MCGHIFQEQKAILISDTILQEAPVQINQALDPTVTYYGSKR